MNKLLIVGMGGFLGSVLRYLMSGYVQKWSESIDFPYGTLAVNLAGCLLIGMLTRMDEMRHVLSSETRLLIMIGLLGAFTTYSTFSNETINLINDRRFISAFTNVAIHIIFGLAAVMIGRTTTYLIWR